MRLTAILLAAAVGFGAAGGRADYTPPDKQHPAETVLVIPFNMLNVPDNQQWIGKGVQETIITDLKGSGMYQPMTFTGQVVVEDNAGAARLARNANAPLAIRGTAQVVGDHVRLTAQLVDAKSADTLRSASATGSTADLLALEDEISAQLRGQSTLHAPASTAPAAAQTPSAAPIIIINNSPSTAYPAGYSTPAYDYYAQWPYWYGYYPGSWPVIVTGGEEFHHDHVEHHDGFHDGTIQHARQNGPVPGAPAVNSNPMALPIPNTNLLPIPTTNLLPIPVNNSLPAPRVNPLPMPQNAPLPTMRVAPLTVQQGNRQDH